MSSSEKPSNEKRRIVLAVVGAAITLATFFVKDGISTAYSGRIAAISEALNRFDSFGLLVSIGARVDKTSNIAERILDKEQKYLKDLEIEEEKIHWHEYKNTIRIVADLLDTLNLQSGPAYDLLGRVKTAHEKYGNDIDAVLKKKAASEEPNAPPMMLTFQGMALEAHLGNLVTVAKQTALDTRRALAQRLSIARWTASTLFLLGWLVAFLALIVGRVGQSAVKPRRWRVGPQPRLPDSGRR
jgi:hypothetical protein